jgi:hypothetical protein
MQSGELNKLAVAAVCVALAIACNSKSKRAGDPAGEPERYSATVVRSVNDGVERELSIARVFKSGDMWRQEWTQQDESYALIWRPDLGKMYELDLARRCYVENETNPKEANLPTGEQAVPEVPDSVDAVRGKAGAEAVEQALGDAPSPERIEVQQLSDTTVDGHVCEVFERREIFPDNHVVVTTTFRARELGGLAIRVETGPAPGAGTRLILMLRDVRLDVPADAFVVPADFRKVDKLPR